MSQRQKREVEVIESRKRTGRNKKGKGKKILGKEKDK